MSFLSGLFSKGDDGYSVAGKLWRNGITSLTGGAVDALAISQHTRGIQADGGTGTNALFQGLGAALMAGQNEYLSSNGKATSITDAAQKGGIDYYLKKYLPWLICGVAALVGVFFLLLKSVADGKEK